jgi:hypothetical protein
MSLRTTRFYIYPKEQIAGWCTGVQVTVLPDGALDVLGDKGEHMIMRDYALPPHVFKAKKWEMRPGMVGTRIDWSHDGPSTTEFSTKNLMEKMREYEF